MKKLVLIAAVAALSACTQKADDAAATDTTAMASETPTMAADTGVTPGAYDVKEADGTMGKTVINADGSYVDTDKNGKEMKGTYARKDGKDCFDPAGDAPEECWAVTTPGADGSFTATSADGKHTVTVTPAAATATMTTAAPAAAAT